MTESGPIIFGVRHLSPTASFDLLRLLNELKPDYVLVEGPSDADDFISFIVSKETKAPLALLAYTVESPVRSILYPFAEYSPEYVALKWASENNARAHFIDLEASQFLSMQEDHSEELFDHESLSKSEGFSDYDTWWEQTFEANINPDAFRQSAYALGNGLRQEEEMRGGISDYNLIREEAMRQNIQKIISSGVKPEKIIVVCGAFHAPNLNPLVSNLLPRNSKLENITKAKIKLALMPYSYYRLSSRSGYGAGNHAPSYYGLIWKQNLGELPFGLTTTYLSKVANIMRLDGNHRSSADVIEAVRLAQTLASFRGSSAPTLSDIKDAAITILGRGESSVLAKSFAVCDIGSEIGLVPKGAGLTATQEDFYKNIQELKLAPYIKLEKSILELDIRENRRVKNDDSAFLDLRRSFFLHQVEIIGVNFGSLEPKNINRPSYEEIWTLKWEPSSEVALAEGSLLGDTIALASAYALCEQLKGSTSVATCSAIAHKACQCGLENTLREAIIYAQSASVENSSFSELADASWSLYQILIIAKLRNINSQDVTSLLAEFFYGASLRLVDASKCDEKSSRELSKKIAALDTLSLNLYEDLDSKEWLKALHEIASRDDVSAFLSGFSLALLLEKNIQVQSTNSVNEDFLDKELSRRLSPGLPADIGAAWFEGFASRNKAALLSRLSVWKAIDEYLLSLDDLVFKTALVSLRRALSTFSPKEKRLLSENLGVLWGLDSENAENALRSELSDEEKTKLDELGSIDFDDI